MSFRIAGLDPAPFRALFELGDDALAARGVERTVAKGDVGWPCRVTLDDAAAGERVLLLNYEHQPAATPFRAANAIYVRESAREPCSAVDEVPPALGRRLLSLRAFDARGYLVDAHVVDGRELGDVAERLLAAPDVAYLHAHYAKPGCFAARIDRA